MAENNSGTIERIAFELTQVLTPLVDRLHHRRVLDVFAEFGLVIPQSQISPGLENAFQQTSESAISLEQLAEELITAIDNEEIETSIVKGVEIVQQVKLLVESIVTITNEVDSLGATGGMSTEDFEDFIGNFAGRLSETLLVEHLDGYFPSLFRVMELFGLITLTPKNQAATDTKRPSYMEKRLHLDLLSTFLDNPMSLFENAFKWGGDDLDADLLVHRLYYMLNSFGVPITRKTIEDGDPRLALEWMLFSLTRTSGISPKGLEATVMMELIKDLNFVIPLSDEWAIEVEIGLGMDASAGIRIQPPAELSLVPVQGSPQGKVSVKMIKTSPQDDGRLSILTLGGSSGITAGAIGVGMVTTFIWDIASNEAKSSLGVEASIAQGKVKISSEGADGFLADLLSGIELDTDFDLKVGWNSENGFYFTGSSTLSIQLPLHVNLGSIEIDALTLGIGIADGGFPLEFSTNIKAALGPLQVAVERMGVSAKITPAAGFSGNLGMIDMETGFKPPNGLGLSIDAGAVKGGGYLYFDFDREEYAGALELIFSEWIALKAIGIVTTKMPDGSKGFSLLIIVSVEFGTGIQLGFGFTLLGVGGLLGLNRTVKIDPLAQGIRTGSVNSVMFPQNIIANAPKIISDLKTFFPVQEGQFLIGPMAKIGYGTPTLVSLSLGVIIEFPTVSITILGVLKVALPDDNVTILKLQVNFIGRIEPSNKLLWFYAELFDSKILFLTIEGGMGLLVNWGDQSNFVLSVGGFHPRYTPPPLPFPSPPRLAINILNESYARVRIEGYFAVTSNTVQFGARVEVYFGMSAFNIDGHFGFDALFQFDPFFFIFELSVSLSVKLFGMGLFSVGFNGLLEGPSPWHIKGKGKISLFLFSVSVPFEETWGEERHTELPPIEILPLIERELDAITNWEAVIPTSSNILVTLRQLGETAESDATNDTLVLHPVGKLKINQRKMPLNLELDKLGNQRPSDVNNLSITANIGGGDMLSTPYMKEKFASGEFRDLDESSKLSSPGFELYDSGVEVMPEGEQVKTSMAVKRIIRYETIIIDNNFKRRLIRFFSIVHTVFTNLFATLFSHFLKGNAVTKSTQSHSYRKKIKPKNQEVKVLANQYSVAFNSDNKPVTNEAMAFNSHANAIDYLREQIRLDPKAAANMHVLPNTEINLAA
jgi:hypothetical protein